MHLEISKLFDVLVEDDKLDCVWDKEDIITKLSQYLTEDKINYLVNLFDMESRCIPKSKNIIWKHASAFINSIIQYWGFKIILLSRKNKDRNKIIFENLNLFTPNMHPILK